MPTISLDLPAIKTSAFETIDGCEKWGTLTAIDLNAKGKIQWQQKTEDPLIGVVLANAGWLVLTGKGGRSALRLALIVTASNTENDISYGSGAEARL